MNNYENGMTIKAGSYILDKKNLYYNEKNTNLLETAEGRSYMYSSVNHDCDNPETKATINDLFHKMSPEARDIFLLMLIDGISFLKGKWGKENHFSQKAVSRYLDKKKISVRKKRFVFGELLSFLKYLTK